LSRICFSNIDEDYVAAHANPRRLSSSSIAPDMLLTSHAWFAPSRDDMDFRVADSMQHVRIPIKLTKAVFSPLIYTTQNLSSKTSIFHALLKSLPNLTQVADGSRILSKTDLTWQSPSENTFAKDYYIGAEAIIHLLYGANIELSQKEALLALLKKAYSADIKANKVNFTLDSIVSTPTKYPLWGKYYLLTDYDLTDRQPLDQIKFLDVSTNFPVLMNLQCIQDVVDTLPKVITVLPLNMRIDNPIGNSTKATKHPLTLKYAEIINANNMLAGMSDMTTTKTYCSAYKTLYKAVYNLYHKTPTDKYDGCALLSSIKSKHGFIRWNVLGKRIDYSGRSVITVNPEIPVDSIGIPRVMLAKLLLQHLCRELSVQDTLSSRYLNSLVRAKNYDKVCDMMEANGLFSKVPILVGRQPTLHKLSMQAYKIVPTRGKSIEINPLITAPFNADFDGDTFYCFPPLTEKAIEEVKAFAMNIDNIYAPKDSGITLMPRQEVIYGLNVLTTMRDYGVDHGYTYSDPKVLLDAVYNKKINVYDKVKVQGATTTAGRAVFDYLMGSVFNTLPYPITKGNIEGILEDIIDSDKSKVVERLNNLCKWGFRMAYLYPTPLSIWESPEYPAAKDKYTKEVKILDNLKYVGFVDTANYSKEFSDIVAEYNTTIEKGIVGKLLEADPSNGFALLTKSGARGSNSNLNQIFTHKGQISKDSTSKFDFLIDVPLRDQLTPLEHSITAYGGRKGHIDKNLNVADTGYDTRKMSHSSAHILINEHDCGTDEGFVFNKREMYQYFPDEKELTKRLGMFLRGRYLAKPIGPYDTNTLLTAEMANDIAVKYDNIEMRSPTKCKSSCCAKCYGVDLTTRKLATVGYSCGLAAAHSITEPSTQLTMNTFHSGGVAGKKDVVSNYERLTNYFGNSDISKKGYYTPVAWDTGKVNVAEARDHVKVTIGEKALKFPKSILPVKDYVNKGDVLSVNPGDFNIREMVEYGGVSKAQRATIYQMFNLFIDETYINLKHFEVLLSAMTVYKCLHSTDNVYQPGNYYTQHYVNNTPHENVTLSATIKGIQDIPSIIGPLTGILLEDQRDILNKATLMRSHDDLHDPYAQIALGMAPRLGSYYSEFRKE